MAEDDGGVDYGFAQLTVAGGATGRWPGLVDDRLPDEGAKPMFSIVAGPGESLRFKHLPMFLPCESTAPP